MKLTKIQDLNDEQSKEVKIKIGKKDVCCDFCHKKIETSYYHLCIEHFKVYCITCAKNHNYSAPQFYDMAHCQSKVLHSNGALWVNCILERRYRE